MKAPQTSGQFLELLQKSRLLLPNRIERYLLELNSRGMQPDSAVDLAQLMVFDKILTKFQARYLLLGKWQNFFIKGKFKVLDRLGAGGESTVILCEHCHLNRFVALKLLPEASTSPAQIQRFHREAQAISMLEHPNIVRIHDVDSDGKLHFIVMEFVQGINLQSVVSNRGILSVPYAVNYIMQSLQGLQHAFEMGLVHRDIKPANLILDSEGVVKITDFGLAQSQISRDEAKSDPSESSFLGTVDYISPEQAMNPDRADIRSDLYSLGATLRFLLLGETLFQGKNMPQKLMMHQMIVPPPTHTLRGDIPIELSNIISRMLEKNPDHRPSMPAQVMDDLMPWFERVENLPMNVPLLIEQQNEDSVEDTRRRREFATERGKRVVSRS